ncbi:aminopeptidase N [Microterricola viridarii]|uniref:Aminopeptidase N n=1 Tax=Microterricola viridarii TaxID=412690 RepID=A0A1H1TL12_9MICO|nr:aminopeptidase N [Microterricola viridarii]SDS61025.1 Membrane alanyl aminopeptidase Metallo peptidase. MEROPS family M01 [Microterricola viridarii]
MAESNLTRVEAVERAAVIREPNYEIEIDLTRGEELFGSATTVRFTAEPGSSSFIEANTRAVHSVTLNGVALDPSAVSDGLRIRLDGLQAVNELHVVADSAYTNTGEGLHRFTDPVDGKPYLYTEFAVAEANRVFACFDQPDLKASYRFTVVAPADWHVISNSTTPAPSPRGDAAEWAFPPSPHISTYIAALIAGPYSEWHSEAVTADGRTIPLGLFARASLAEAVEPEVMFEKTRQGLAYYEASYGVGFPYEKYDQIFVPEYNWGAMENVGAVTFNEGYLFRSKVPDARKEQRALVVLHELSHMWFGNLVTMKWWNDLWLNESFATWTSTIAAASATEYADSWATFASTEKTHAYEQDQLPSTHPIVATINDLEDVEVNFDGITYSKGASVIKQLVAWVGLDAFYAGISAYLQKHAGGNATLRDLLDELEVTSGRELTEWSRLWLETAGVNTLRPEIQTTPDGTITGFAVLQSAASEQPTIRPHRLAIGFYNTVDGALVRAHRVELDVDGDRTEVAELVGLARPELVLLNDDDLAYAKIRLDAASHAVAIDRLAEIADPLARAVIWGAVWDATRDAEASPRDFVKLVLRNISAETQSAQRALSLRLLELVLGQYVAPEHRAETVVEAGDALWALTQSADAGSDAQLQLLRAFIAIASAPGQLDVLVELLAGEALLPGLAVDTELRWEIVISLAAGGRAAAEDIDDVLATDDTAKGRQSAITAKAAMPDAAGKLAAWTAAATDTSLSNDYVRAYALGWRRARPSELLSPQLEPYFAMLQEVWSTRSYNMAAAIIRGLYPAPLANAELVAASRAWLAGNDGPPALRRIVVEELSRVERALAAQERDRA